ncbi:MAG: hypothetical protein K0R75_2080 [Paenibacillaceae bacterium]|jgi:hypothetical protein|nr:hypothetical protein [Paenibacillaceae bacterium]
MASENSKLPYEKPQLTKHAQLREVTLDSSGGNNGKGNDNGKGSADVFQ